MRTVVLLIIANIFMTFAWYGHLRHMNVPLWSAILVSWLIAGLEYVFQVPANRFGAQAGWTGFQLKITQEVITISVFIVFAVLYLKEPVRWNHAAAFVLLIGAVALVFGVKAPAVVPVGPAPPLAGTGNTSVASASVLP
jgi:uncharacterized protein (DUF486 family)